MTEEPVTVVVTRRIKAGSEQAYERWLEALVREASALPGYLGTNVYRPAPGAAREYTSVFRFDSVENLRRFEESELRAKALVEVRPLVDADAVWTKITGLEFWFTPPASAALAPQPSKLRMALLMIAVVWGLVLSIGKLVGLVLGAAPMPLRLLVTITIEVFLMTYVLMPRLTRWLARWIYPS
ncbi:MAG: antibiotic biosynthesis monooxygenase [Myxococcales bacterium]|nr:antibiotic biosynthesis monooxygenase [Myxococcales bacterium]